MYCTFSNHFIEPRGEQRHSDNIVKHKQLFFLSVSSWPEVRVVQGTEISQLVIRNSIAMRA